MESRGRKRSAGGRITQGHSTGGTRHTVFCMKVTPVVGEAGSAGELRKARATAVPSRILACAAE